MSVSRWQFTLRHIACVFLFVGAFLALFLWDRQLGIAMFTAAFGLLVIVACIYKRNGACAILGVFLILIGASIPAIPVVVADGWSTLPCTIRVIETTSGTPVPDAKVRIRDIELYGRPEGVPVNPVPVGERGVDGVTDRNGMVTIDFEFHNSSHTSVFVDEAHVFVSPFLWIQVEASGYETALVRLDSFTGSSYDWYSLPLPQMEVKIERRPP